ncbi:hypothetical protein MTO96_035910 [Rhipicephalus appendiculatus]
MINTGKLAGRTLFITGASRGIGKEIALKAAKDGANVVIAAKTAEPHPQASGYHIYSCQGSSKYCIPHLKKSSNPHILMLSPPLIMKPMWFQNHLAYTMSKYGMSMCVLGLSEELRTDGIAVNAVWPKTAIHTAAIEMLMGAEHGQSTSRKPTIMADAAYAILTKPSRSFTGNFCIDKTAAEGGRCQGLRTVFLCAWLQAAAGLLHSGRRPRRV